MLGLFIEITRGLDYIFPSSTKHCRANKEDRGV